MRRDRASRGGSAAMYPVLSDRPTEVHNPQRKVRIIAITYAVAILVTALAGAYVAATIAVDQSDDAKRQLRAELDRRTKQRTLESDRFARALEQYRRDQCEITGRLEQTPEIVEIRTRYRCTNPVVPPAAGSVPGSPSTPGDQGPPASSRSGGTGGSSATPRARPAPAPAPPGARPPVIPVPPQPAPGIPPVPALPNPPARLCLPLIGCIL